MVQQPDVGTGDRCGEVVGGRARHGAEPFPQGEALDAVPFAAVQVDGAFVELHLRRHSIHLTDHAACAAARVDDDDVLRRGGAQRDLFRRIGAVRPVPRAAGVVDDSLLLQVPERLAGARRLDRAVAVRQLEDRALELVEQDVDIVGIDVPGLRRGGEQVLGMTDDELVYRRRGGDQDRQRQFVGAAGAARLLPAGGDRAGKAGHHRCIQPADVDAQLQRVGRHHAEQRPVAQAALDPAPLVRQIAAAIGGDGVAVRFGGVRFGAVRRRVVRRRAVRWAAAQGLPDIGGDQLRARARAGEHDRLHAPAQQTGGDLVRFVDHAAPGAPQRVEQRRVVEQKVALPGRRAVAVDQDRVLLDDAAGQLQRVADGRRAADEARPRPVERRDPFQAADDVGQVRSEDAAVDVQFVDHHEAQLGQEPAPLGMMRQHAGVQHVGVGDDDAPLLARRDAGRRRRVAVVRAGGHRQAAGLRHRRQLRLLVARQRLGRKEIEGGRAGVAQEVRQDRQVVGEGLARSGRRDQHGVVAGAHVPVGVRLVAIEPLDAACAQQAPQAAVQLLRKRRILAGARRQHLPVSDVAHEGTVAAQLGQHRAQRRTYRQYLPSPYGRYPVPAMHGKGAAAPP